jgi:hypothetical protein
MSSWQNLFFALHNQIMVHWAKICEPSIANAQRRQATAASTRESEAMFAPKVAKPQMKAAVSSTGNLAHQRSTSGVRQAVREPPGAAWNFSRIAVFSPGWTGQSYAPSQAALSLPVVIQPKLAVGPVDDPLEHEADRVADQVMRMPLQPRFRAAPLEHGQGVAREREERLHNGPVAPQAGAGKETLQSKSAGPPAAGREAPASVHEVFGSPGQPLDAATRGFFEPPFGYDFSQVRIHCDSAAAQSARDVNARAYTVGHNIVFGAGQFAPQTHNGQRLLAHELTHVVQQSGHEGPLRIQRKEILASASGGSRYRTGVAEIAPEDWTEPDREEWEALSASGNERMLNRGNTFMRAAWHNTLNMRPGEYQTIRERHDYYDLISYVIQYDPGTPKAVRDVRFFHAATAVTGHPGIGSVETTTGLVKLGADTRQVLREVNAELFALNMGIIRNLLSNWKEPRDPQNPAGQINAFDFDIRMVETEQGTVENYITRNKARFTPSVVQDINATTDPTEFGQFFNFSQRSFEWAIKALGVPALDFTKREHRQAIGFASVHIFHRKSEQDYLAFMKQRVPYVRPPNQYVVGNLSGVTLNEGLPGPLLTYDLPVGTVVEVINWSHYMGPYRIGDVYAGKVEVKVLDGTYKGKTGWVDFADLG